MGLRGRRWREEGEEEEEEEGLLLCGSVGVGRGRAGRGGTRWCRLLGTAVVEGRGRRRQLPPLLCLLIEEEEGGRRKAEVVVGLLLAAATTRREAAAPLMLPTNLLLRLRLVGSVGVGMLCVVEKGVGRNTACLKHTACLCFGLKMQRRRRRRRRI